eukprot:TRINITY_DN6049_c0_g1_i1.p1 TRINITY_DN6049_c0_g1~~TRINITY_DN6049_c0_g1_i1.p1  ORF type:complete len:577 (+),score=99.31 TRINITY_DN6049_c0_g1_i1:1459-3189(+)
MDPVQDTPSLPPLKYTYKGKGGVQTFRYAGPPSAEGEKPFQKDVLEKTSDDSATTFEYSKDGSLLAIVNKEGVSIIKSASGDVVNQISRLGVLHISISSGNTFLLTFERYVKDGEENLVVWNIKTGEPVRKFHQKIFTRENWPYVKWSDDETVCGHMVQNEIHFYNPSLTKVVQTMRVPNVTAFCISPAIGNSSYKIATFVPEKQGAPSVVQLVEYPRVSESLTSKSFFKANSADFFWNSTGSSLLIVSHTDVDKTGKSYYGEDGLFFLSSDGSFKNLPLSKEGPIHECVWSPDGTQFLVIYGYMPAKATLYGVDGVAKADFGSAPRNTGRFSPDGQLLIIAGFGNLLGDMDFWDTKRIKLIGKAQAHCSAYYEWSPDSKYVVTAILSPRIRVDNGYKIFDFQGNFLQEDKVNELTGVNWRPALSGVYPNVKHNFTRKDLATSNTTTTTTTSTAKYRHPNFTGNSTSLRKEDDGPRKYKTKPEPQPKYAQPANQESGQRRRGKKKEVVPEQSPTVALLAAEVQDPQKQIKELTKQLRTIAQLKDQQSNGKVMTDNQLAKIESEQSVLNQLNSLNKF